MAAQLPTLIDLNRSQWIDHLRPIVFSTNDDLRKYDATLHPTLHDLSRKVGSYYWENCPSGLLVIPAYAADVVGVWSARAILVLTDKGPTALRALGLGIALIVRAAVSAILGIPPAIAIIAAIILIAVPLYVLFITLSTLAEKICVGVREIFRYSTNYYVIEQLRSENAALKAQLGDDGLSALRLDGGGLGLQPERSDEEYLPIGGEDTSMLEQLAEAFNERRGADFDRDDVKYDEQGNVFPSPNKS